MIHGPLARAPVSGALPSRHWLTLVETRRGQLLDAVEGSVATGQQDPSAITTAPQASAEGFSGEDIPQLSDIAKEVSSISQEYGQKFQQDEGEQAQQDPELMKKLQEQSCPLLASSR